MNDDQQGSTIALMPVSPQQIQSRNLIETQSGSSVGPQEAQLGELAQLLLNSQAMGSEANSDTFDGAVHTESPLGQPAPWWENARAAETLPPQEATADFAQQMRMLGDAPQEGGAQAGFLDHPTLPVRNVDGATPLDLTNRSGSLFNSAERNHAQKLQEARQYIQEMKPKTAVSPEAVAAPLASLASPEHAQLARLRAEILAAKDQQAALRMKLNKKGPSSHQMKVTQELENPRNPISVFLQSLGILRMTNRELQLSVQSNRAMELARQRAAQKARIQAGGMFGEARMNAEQQKRSDLMMMGGEIGGDQD